MRPIVGEPVPSSSVSFLPNWLRDHRPYGGGGEAGRQGNRKVADPREQYCVRQRPVAVGIIPLLDGNDVVLLDPALEGGKRRVEAV